MASNEEEFEYGTVHTSTLDIQPFQFEPLPGTSRKRGRPNTPNRQEEDVGDSESDDSDTNIDRIGNSDWCECNYCVPMPTGRESLCCSEIPKVSSNADDANCQCITQLDGFTPVCLNIDVVMTAIYQYIEDEEYINDHPTCELFRYISYRQFVRWVWHYLGKHQRKILSSCVVNKIRCAFPSDEYTGFKYPEIDY